MRRAASKPSISGIWQSSSTRSGRALSVWHTRSTTPTPLATRSTASPRRASEASATTALTSLSSASSTVPLNAPVRCAGAAAVVGEGPLGARGRCSGSDTSKVEPTPSVLW